MRRRAIGILLCLFLCMSLGSCGVKQGADGEDNVTATDRSVGNAPTDEVGNTAPAPEGAGPAAEGRPEVYAYSVIDDEKLEAYEAQIAAIEYPCVGLSDRSAAEYPALAQALTELNDEMMRYATEQYDSFKDGAEQSFLDLPEEYVRFEVRQRVSVRRADAAVLSLLYDTYTYAGGENGSRSWFAVDLDVETGERLSLDDAVADVSALPEIVVQLLRQHYPDVRFYEPLDLTARFSQDAEDLCWVLDPTGLTIVLPPYCVADPSYGSFTVTVDRAAFPALFRQRYAPQAASYAVTLPLDLPYYGDLDGDGTTDVLTVHGDADEYGVYQRRSVKLNKNTVRDETYAAAIEPVLLHTADKGDLLYVQEQLDTDHKQLTVYRIAKGKPVKEDTVSMGRPVRAFDGDRGCLVLTDPERFVLESSTELLSTVAGRRICTVGEDGTPKPEDEMYLLAKELVLTLKRELNVSVLDAEGRPAGEKTLQKGAKLSYFRTDGEKYADLKLENGDVVRVAAERSDWGFTVDGADVKDVFKGVVYG